MEADNKSVSVSIGGTAGEVSVSQYLREEREFYRGYGFSKMSCDIAIALLSAKDEGPSGLLIPMLERYVINGDVDLLPNSNELSEAFPLLALELRFNLSEALQAAGKM